MQNCFSAEQTKLILKCKHEPSGCDTERMSQGTPYYIQIMIVMCSICVIDNVYHLFKQQ